MIGGWPATIFGVALLGAIVALGVTHVISGEWIQSTLSALIGAGAYGTVHLIGQRNATRSS